jgi:hypothetical protein
MGRPLLRVSAPKQKLGCNPTPLVRHTLTRMPVEFQIEEFMDEEIEEFLRNLRSTDPLRALLIAELARRSCPAPTASQAPRPAAGAPAQPPRRSARLASACTRAS